MFFNLSLDLHTGSRWFSSWYKQCGCARVSRWNIMCYCLNKRQTCLFSLSNQSREEYSDQAVNVKDVLSLTDPLYFISFDSELLLLLLLFIDHLHMILFHFIFLQWMLSSSIRWGLICCLDRFCLFCFFYWQSRNFKQQHQPRISHSKSACFRA